MERSRRMEKRKCMCVIFIFSSLYSCSRTSAKEFGGNCNGEGIAEWLGDFAENLEMAELPAIAHISQDSDLERLVKWHHGSTRLRCVTLSRLSHPLSYLLSHGEGKGGSDGIVTVCKRWEEGRHTCIAWSSVAYGPTATCGWYLSLCEVSTAI